MSKERQEAKDGSLEQTRIILPAISQCKQILNALKTRLDTDSPSKCKRAKLTDDNDDVACSGKKCNLFSSRQIILICNF